MAIALSDGERILGPVIGSRPFWSLLKSGAAGDPAACPFSIEDAGACPCAREALAPGDVEPPLRHDDHGLVHVAVPLRIEGEIAGVALLGQMFSAVPDPAGITRLAEITRCSASGLWELVRHCLPISQRRLQECVEMLRILGGSVLAIRHQQLLLEQELREQMQERARLEALRARLDERDRRKDHFLALLGHEIRNPLAAIVNLAQLIESAPSRDVTDRLMRQVEQLTRLSDDLLDMSQITRGTIELRREVMDLRALARQALEPFTTSVEQTRRIEVSLPDHPVLVEGDPSRIVQIVSNLLDNAVKFTEPGDRIVLSLEGGPDEAWLRVRDFGAGFDPARSEEMFEAFVQGSEPRRPGLGIGLSLVRSLVERHGGEIRATSAGPGWGSEFAVRLPRVHHDHVPDAGAPVLPATRRRRILVVDDDRAVADSLGDVLGRFHHVRVAYDGESALVAARSFAPDVVVSDLQMPRMDGFALARRLRAEHGRSLRLVALSGYRREIDVRDAAEAGFDRLLTKPVKAADLEDALEDVAGDRG